MWRLTSSFSRTQSCGTTWSKTSHGQRGLSSPRFHHRWRSVPRTYPYLDVLSTRWSGVVGEPVSRWHVVLGNAMAADATKHEEKGTALPSIFTRLNTQSNKRQMPFGSFECCLIVITLALVRTIFPSANVGYRPHVKSCGQPGKHVCFLLQQKHRYASQQQIE